MCSHNVISGQMRRSGLGGRLFLIVHRKSIKFQHSCTRATFATKMMRDRAAAACTNQLQLWNSQISDSEIAAVSGNLFFCCSSCTGCRWHEEKSSMQAFFSSETYASSCSTWSSCELVTAWTFGQHHEHNLAATASKTRTSCTLKGDNQYRRCRLSQHNLESCKRDAAAKRCSYDGRNTGKFGCEKGWWWGCGGGVVGWHSLYVKMRAFGRISEKSENVKNWLIFRNRQKSK